MEQPKNLQILLRRNLQLLQFVGSNPYKQNWFSYVMKFVTFASLSVLMGLTSTQIFLEWDGVETLSKIDYLPTIFLAFSKNLFLIANVKPLKKLIDSFANFWPLTKFGQKIFNETQRIHNVSYSLMKFYIALCWICGILVFILPFVFNTKNLIYPLVEPCDLQKSSCFALVYAWQTFVLFFEFCPTIVVFDSLFLSLILGPYVGIQMVKHAFREMIIVGEGRFDEKSKANLKEIVSQHNVILNSINEINKLFSSILMVHYLCALVSQIFSLYMLTEDGIPPDSTRVSRYGVIYVLFLFQLLIYSIGGMLLIQQTASVAEEAYAIDWYAKTEPEMRKTLAFVILRSQRPNTISVGKIANLDLVSFVAIVKNALSVYALLRQLHEEKQIRQN